MRIMKPHVIRKSLDLRELSSEDRQKIEADFWPKVHRNRKDGCWRWGYKTPQLPHRMGMFVWKNEQYPAHRFMWALQYGVVYKGTYLWHTCGIANCVNPAHLAYGDYEKMSDWFEQRPQLTPDQVKEIRHLYRQEHKPLHELREQYGLLDRELRKVLFP